MRLFALFLSVLSFALLASSDAAPSSDELVQACTAGELSKVRQLLERGAQVNEPDAEGRLPLLAALFSRKTDVVSLLLKRGAASSAGTRR